MPDAEDPFVQASFLEEQSREERREFRTQLVRWMAGFVFLFFCVFFTFWWSGAAVRFGASRVAESTQTTYRIWGTVRDANSRRPVAWAQVHDEISGKPPYASTVANREGQYELLTIAEPHRVVVTASGYNPLIIKAGRQWFLWMPSGSERRDLDLTPQ